MKNLKHIWVSCDTNTILSYKKGENGVIAIRYDGDKAYINYEDRMFVINLQNATYWEISEDK